MSENITITFSNNGAVSDGAIRLEQEAIPYANQTVSAYDLNQMLARVMSGESATTYIDDSCSYLKVKDGVVTVILNFYVWPRSLDQAYTVEASFGDISDPESLELYRSFDLLFDNSRVAESDFVIEDFTFTPEMPFIKSDGSLFLADPVFAPTGRNLKSDKTVSTVLRAEGLARGYKHSVTMELTKAEEAPEFIYKIGSWVESGCQYNQGDFPVVLTTDIVEGSWEIDFQTDTTFSLNPPGNIETIYGGSTAADFVTPYMTIKKDGWQSSDAGAYIKFIVVKRENSSALRTGFNISNLQNSIIASWIGDDGKTYTETLRLEFPECVTSLLSACGEGYDGLKWAMNLNSGRGDSYLNVYYSTCTGKVVAARWEKNE